MVAADLQAAIIVKRIEQSDHSMALGDRPLPNPQGLPQLSQSTNFIRLNSNNSGSQNLSINP
jgi:hypothetical protein